MAPVIRDGALVDDAWQLVETGDAARLESAAGEPLILPLAVALRYPFLLDAGGRRNGVWLGPDDAPEALLPLLPRAALVAVRFPSFTDGRGYSLGRLIRQRYGYAGELRAVGDILRDQIYFLRQCGFNAFALRADQRPAEALAALGDYCWSGGAR